jgi:hypothetical protein
LMRATAFVITRIAHGQPSECVRYDHSYADLVELNDTDFTKSYIKKHPQWAERSFTLRKPRHTRVYIKDISEDHTRNAEPVERRLLVPRGAFRRAVAAGLVPEALADMGFE